MGYTNPFPWVLHLSEMGTLPSIIFCLPWKSPGHTGVIQQTEDEVGEKTFCSWLCCFTFLSLSPAAVLYCYFYKRTALHLGDPRFYQDSLWLRKEFAQVRS